MFRCALDIDKYGCTETNDTGNTQNVKYPFYFQGIQALLPVDYYMWVHFYGNMLKI